MPNDPSHNIRNNLAGNICDTRREFMLQDELSDIMKIYK